MTEISSAIKEDHATWQSGMNIRVRHLKARLGESVASSSSINTPKRIETPDLTTDDEDPAPAPHPLIRENISFAPLPLSSANWSLVEELDKASGGATKLFDIDAVIKHEWQEEERRRFMTDLASAPIGSSKDEQRKRVKSGYANYLKIADEIGWGGVKIKSEKELGEILGPDRRRTSTGLSERDHSMQPTANQQATRGECPPRLACSYMNEGRSI
ncbi:hypothetical protein NCU10936 [Neurospora crassa OR74A]|uniref:Uncharacterized protein n=1 Tax=Neurospora crassa (strain ATCC 24698 / 74-OR23-1A / CBS 708.71 / DSM 1257 / FGSC 987) TaxID=367110 RepID=A7UX03_NEUCR|nr:hypothetical protein NCU10936 [Neurospora crassa OR74A]EDO65030.2 hypothetical protein NCU10936 [Neurospora crassa OR74A]|eukprot:XP_001728121.2 hypothetical protein NCU10936 [Neurospora crassa OR74A]